MNNQKKPDHPGQTVYPNQMIRLGPPNQPFPPGPPNQPFPPGPTGQVFPPGQSPRKLKKPWLIAVVATLSLLAVSLVGYGAVKLWSNPRGETDRFSSPTAKSTETNQSEPKHPAVTTNPKAIRNIDPQHLLLPLPTSKCFNTPEDSYHFQPGSNNIAMLPTGVLPTANFVKMPDQPDECFGDTLITKNHWVALDKKLISDGRQAVKTGKQWPAQRMDLQREGVRLNFFASRVPDNENQTQPMKEVTYVDLNGDGYEDAEIVSQGEDCDCNGLGDPGGALFSSLLIYIFDPTDPTHPWASSIRSFADQKYSYRANQRPPDYPESDDFFPTAPIATVANQHIFFGVKIDNSKNQFLREYQLIGKGKNLKLVGISEHKGIDLEKELNKLAASSRSYPTVGLNRPKLYNTEQ